LTLGELGGNSSAGNDCWGYVSPSGKEYALMCTNRGTAFVEVTDPGDPEILVFHNGPSSTWRDIKVYGEYAYAVSEGGNGIQCFDLRTSIQDPFHHRTKSRPVVRAAPTTSPSTSTAGTSIAVVVDRTSVFESTISSPIP
jgi:hypothetical protein